MSMVAHLDQRVAAALESTSTKCSHPTRAVSRRPIFVGVVLSFLLLPAISTCPTSMCHFSRNSCWRNPMRLRGGAMRAAERVSEVHEGGHGSERCKADAANAGMSRALGESWRQLDPIVSEYICKVLADATPGEERDLASFLPSISSLLDAHGVCLLPPFISNLSAACLSLPPSHPLSLPPSLAHTPVCAGESIQAVSCSRRERS